MAIYGKGVEWESLARQIEELGLASQASLAGWESDPKKVFHTASIFALSSRYEGFPNSLLEAMSAGIAPIAFDCQTGPGEIVRHDRDGLLVAEDDVDGFAAALTKLMSDEALRRRLGEEAKTVSDRFSRERFFHAWDEVIATASRIGRSG